MMDEPKDSQYGERLKIALDPTIDKSYIENKGIKDLLNLTEYKLNVDLKQVSKSTILDSVNQIIKNLKWNYNDKCNRAAAFLDLNEQKGICAEHHNILMGQKETNKYIKAKAFYSEIEVDAEDLISGLFKFKTVSTFYPQAFKEARLLYS